MESRRFDRLSRLIATGASRRALLRLIATGGAVATGRLVIAAPASAGTICIPDGENCTQYCANGDYCNACCGGFCAAYGGCTDLGYLEAGAVCDLGTPNECAAGRTCCPFSPGHRHGQGVCQDVCY